MKSRIDSQREFLILMWRFEEKLSADFKVLFIHHPQTNLLKKKNRKSSICGKKIKWILDLTRFERRV